MPAKAAGAEPGIHDFFTARCITEVTNAHSNQNFFCFFFSKKACPGLEPGKRLL
jgi:hypothetical protein